MATREEMLRGITKVNDERKDIKAIASGGATKVRDDVGDRADQPAGDGGPHGTPTARLVLGPKESLVEFLARRKGQGIIEVESIDEQLEALTQKRRDLVRELSAIEITLENLDDQ